MVPGRMYELLDRTLQPDNLLVLYAGYGRSLLLAASAFPPFGNWVGAIPKSKLDTVTLVREVRPEDLPLYLHFQDKRPLFGQILRTGTVPDGKTCRSIWKTMDDEARQTKEE